MKKVLVSICALLAGLTVANAQDVNKATELFNNAVEYYASGNLDSALNKFVEAHKEAAACGEEGVEIVTDCETNIPVLGTQIAKELASKGDYAAAVAKLQALVKICESLGLVDDSAKFTKMIPQFYLQQANQAVKAKDFVTALAAFDNVLALDPTNGKALLSKGQVLNATGDIAGAQSAFELALANGQEKAAKRQLANLFVKKAKAASGEKKYNDALAFAKQAISYDESEANAYYLGGIAAQALNKNSEAIELFEKYLVLKPSDSKSQAVRQVVEALKKGAK